MDDGAKVRHAWPSAAGIGRGLATLHPSPSPNHVSKVESRCKLSERQNLDSSIAQRIAAEVDTVTPRDRLRPNEFAQRRAELGSPGPRGLHFDLDRLSIPTDCLPRDQMKSTSLPDGVRQ